MIDIRNQKISGTRADKVAAQAMLGRVYMTMSGFPLNDTSAQSLAEVELKAVIDYSEANANKYWAPDSTEWKNNGWLNIIINILFLLYNIVVVELEIRLSPVRG